MALSLIIWLTPGAGIIRPSCNSYARVRDKPFHSKEIKKK
jgi:hypothetical protein